ncbi:MAG: hypothetical protein QOJ60_1650, partial [Actinomycetota bacterium]|nr:hypothetical protein [Actinomycetota bacterium]
MSVDDTVGLGVDVDVGVVLAVGVGDDEDVGAEPGVDALGRGLDPDAAGLSCSGPMTWGWSTCTFPGA